MTTRTFVLIPGAWHGGWAWRPVAQRLGAVGHRAVTLTLPGLDGDGDPSTFRLSDAVDHVVDEVVKRDLTEVTLVAHSWGGYPVTGAAHRLPGRVSKIVYLSALVPTPGKSLVEDNPPEVGKLMRAMIESSPDYSLTLSLELVQQTLIQDASEETQRLVSDLLVPQPGHYFLDPLELPALVAPGVAVAYLLSEDDRLLPRPGAEFAQRLNVAPTMVPGSHEALLTRPDEITAALLNASA
jgi:pimeloyl-ACP methyl ester carboxylesterase